MFLQSLKLFPASRGLSRRGKMKRHFASWETSASRELKRKGCCSRNNSFHSHIDSVKWPWSPWVLVAQWIENPPGVREGGSWFRFPSGTQIFLMFPARVMFIISLVITELKLHLYSLINTFNCNQSICLIIVVWCCSIPAVGQFGKYYPVH